MTGDEMLGHTQLAAHTAHLVLEQPLQRLAELQMHLLGQSTHIVVALDDLAGNIETLDTVGIDGSLSQPLGAFYLLGLGIEDLDEITAYNLALLLGIGHAGKDGKELVAGVDAHHVETETLVVVHHIGELVLAQHAVVYEDTGEVVTDGAVQQHGCHRRVDTAGETQDDAVFAQLALELSHGGIYKRGGAPVLT